MIVILLPEAVFIEKTVEFFGETLVEGEVPPVFWTGS